MSSEKSQPAQLPPCGLAEEILGKLASEVPPGPDQILRFADAMVSAEAHAKPAAAPELHLVIFKLDAEEFGVDIGRLSEIVRVPTITRVPEAPEHVRGVINVRGRVLPLVDVRTRIGLPPVTPSARSRVLLVTAQQRTIGVLVDSVSCVERIPAAAVTPPPAEVMSAHANYITAVAQLGPRLIMLVDIDKALLLRAAAEGT